MEYSTRFNDKMEQTELQSAQLVVVEIPSHHFFLNGKGKLSSGNYAKRTARKSTQQDHRRCLPSQSLLGGRK